MRILFFIALVSFLSILSCKKKNLQYEISGIVTDASFNTPKANSRVTIQAKKNAGFYTITTLTTGTDGSYSYQLKREQISQVRILVENENYFDEAIETTLENLSLDNPNTFHFNVFAKSWVRLHFTSDGTKKLKYYKQEGKKDCLECCAAGEVAIDYVSDTSIYCINDGNKSYKILYTVLGEGVTGNPSVITTPFDTTELLINY